MSFFLLLLAEKSCSILSPSVIRFSSYHSLLQQGKKNFWSVNSHALVGKNQPQSLIGLYHFDSCLALFWRDLPSAGEMTDPPKRLLRVVFQQDEQPGDATYSFSWGEKSSKKKKFAARTLRRTGLKMLPKPPKLVKKSRINCPWIHISRWRKIDVDASFLFFTLHVAESRKHYM